MPQTFREMSKYEKVWLLFKKIYFHSYQAYYKKKINSMLYITHNQQLEYKTNTM